MRNNVVLNLQYVNLNFLCIPTTLYLTMVMVQQCLNYGADISSIVQTVNGMMKWKQNGLSIFIELQHLTLQ